MELTLNVLTEPTEHIELIYTNQGLINIRDWLEKFWLSKTSIVSFECQILFNINLLFHNGTPAAITIYYKYLNLRLNISYSL